MPLVHLLFGLSSGNSAIMKQLEVKDALPKGFKLHWYEIQGVLGRGGFGITYLARDTNLDCNVAIKEYFPIEYASREGHTQSLEPTTSDNHSVYAWGLEKFVIEARTLAKFSHKNIVRVSSVFDQNNTAYMVMDLEAGQSLADVVRAKVRFDETQLRNMLLGLMSGLEFVHNKGFIHRDIKPANIILRANGDPVLLDFGSARGAMKQTTKLTSLVSFGYTPFEQYHASGDQQGAWTDIYALAGTFHHLLLGTKPAEAMARASALMSNKPDPQLPLSDCKTLGCSQGFLKTLDAGLAFKVEDRPQTMAAWRNMLQMSVPAAPTKKLKQPSRKNDDTVLMRAASGTDYTSYRAAPQKKPVFKILFSGAMALALLGGGFGYWYTVQGFGGVPAVNAPAQPVPVVVMAAQPAASLALPSIAAASTVENETLAAARAAELADIKAERLARAEEKRLEDERLAAQAREAAQRQAEKEAQALLEKQRAEAERIAQEQAAKLKEIERAKELARKAAEAKPEIGKVAPKLVADFKTAFQQKNYQGLIGRHVIAAEKREFIQQLFNAYESFTLSAHPLQINNASNTATAVVSIQSIRAKNGNIVTPGAAWRDMTVTVKPLPGGDFKLYWQ